MSRYFKLLNMKIKIDVSISELIDKITILEIKSEKIKDEVKLKNINYELTILTQIKQKSNIDISSLQDELKSINIILWDVEEQIRLKEKNKLFDDEFIELSRSVYINNDKRAMIKRNIDMLLNSEIVEEKSYDSYI